MPLNFYGEHVNSLEISYEILLSLFSCSFLPSFFLYVVSGGIIKKTSAGLIFMLICYNQAKYSTMYLHAQVV